LYECVFKLTKELLENIQLKFLKKKKNINSPLMLSKHCWYLPCFIF